MFAKLKTAWLAFNHWRRSAFPFRLTALLILVVCSGGLLERAITPNHSPLINELVWIACKAIRYSSEPRIPSAYLHYYRARENQRLQNELRVRLQGGLRLSPDELAAVNARPSKVDNKLLFDIAKRHGIISAGVNQREYMRSMWAASLSMTAMEFDKGWDEVKHDVFNTGKLFGGQRDWRRGIGLFVYILLMIAPVPLTVTAPWFALCLALAFFAVKNPVSKRQCALAIALPVLLTMLWNSRHLVIIFNAPHSPYWDYFVTLRLTYIIYFSILSAIAGILGIRLRRWALERANTDKIWSGLLFITGALLIFQFFFYPARYYYEHEYAYTPFLYGNILCNIPLSVMLLLCLSGAAMTSYAIKSFFQMQAAGRIRRFGIPPELLCYLFWGITAVWCWYLLSLVEDCAFKILLLDFSALSINIAAPAMLLKSNVGNGEEIIAAGLRITAFTGSILCGLILAKSYSKRYFRIINIGALALLIAIFAVLSFFMSCRLEKCYSSSQGNYIKVIFIGK